MKRSVITLCLGLLAVTLINATPVPGFSPKQLAIDSDLIVIGKVTILSSYPSTVSVNGVDYPGKESVATITVESVLKSKGAVPTVIDLKWSIPLPPSGSLGYGSLHDGYQMVFLKRSGEKFAFSSHYYPGIPASAGAALHNEGAGSIGSDDEVLKKITDQMCTFTEDTAQDKDERVYMLHRLWQTKDPRVHETAARLLNDSYFRLRDIALFTLIREKDKDYIPQARKQVLDAMGSEANLPYSEGAGNLVLALLQEFPEDSLSIVAAAKDAKNVSLKGQVAYAARDMRTKKVVPYLIPLVDDLDSEVAWNAMHSLGFLTDHLDWRPLSKDPVEFQRCQSAWHTYASTLSVN